MLVVSEKPWLVRSGEVWYPTAVSSTTALLDNNLVYIATFHNMILQKLISPSGRLHALCDWARMSRARARVAEYEVAFRAA